MRSYIFLILIFIVSNDCLGYNNDIIDLINRTNIDSLLKSVSELSAEKTCIVDGNEVLLNRKNNPSNHLTALYLFEKMKSFGYNSVIQECQSNITEVENVIAIKLGSTHPDKKIIFCAHYDSQAGMNENAPGADDNASGTALVLEAARLFKDSNHDYSIVFALWDAEEIGLLGSKCYANIAKNNTDDILAVINLDMLAYNVSNIYRTIVSIRFDEKSLGIWETVKLLNTNCQINLCLDSIVSATSGSDMVSFWNSGFSGVSFYESDMNPTYHSAGDKMQFFNKDYYLQNAKLSIATLAYLANFTFTSSVCESLKLNKFAISPNPASEYIEIKQPSEGFEPSEDSAIKIYNAYSECVITVGASGRSPLRRIDISHLPTGIYFIRIGNYFEKFVKI